MLNFGKSVPQEIRDILESAVKNMISTPCLVKVRFKNQKYLQENTGHFDCFISGSADYKNGKGFIYLAKEMRDPALLWKMLHCFAHEMAHVIQFDAGSLAYSDTGFLWMGKDWEGDYSEQPWELEAEEYADMFLNQMLIKGIDI